MCLKNKIEYSSRRNRTKRLQHKISQQGLTFCKNQPTNQGDKQIEERKKITKKRKGKKINSQTNLQSNKNILLNFCIYSQIGHTSGDRSHP